MFKHIQENSDFVGIFSASLCLIHCLLLPILANLLAHTSIGEYPFFDYIFLAMAYVAVWYSVKSHTTSFTKKMFGLALFFLSFGILTEEFIDFSAYIAYFSSFSLIVLHYVNFRSCQKCSTAQCEN